MVQYHSITFKIFLNNPCASFNQKAQYSYDVEISISLELQTYIHNCIMLYCTAILKERNCKDNDDTELQWKYSISIRSTTKVSKPISISKAELFWTVLFRIVECLLDSKPFLLSKSPCIFIKHSAAADEVGFEWRSHELNIIKRTKYLKNN